jgi:hypothetical protein
VSLRDMLQTKIKFGDESLDDKEAIQSEIRGIVCQGFDAKCSVSFNI